jgi:hypothetical protein
MKEIQLVEKYKNVINPPQKFILAKKHIESRKISNVFYMPNDFIRADILAEEYEKKTLLDENENEYQVNVKGWIKKNELNIGIMSCKMVEFFINISKNYNGINIVYSSCVKKHGLTLIGTLCNIYKINYLNLVYVEESEIEEKMNDINSLDCPTLVLLDPNTVDLLLAENKRFTQKLNIHIFETELRSNFYKNLLEICGVGGGDRFGQRPPSGSGASVVYRYQSTAPSSSKLPIHENFKCVDEILYEKNNNRSESEYKFKNLLKGETIF